MIFQPFLVLFPEDPEQDTAVDQEKTDKYRCFADGKKIFHDYLLLTAVPRDCRYAINASSSVLSLRSAGAASMSSSV